MFRQPAKPVRCPFFCAANFPLHNVAVLHQEKSRATRKGNMPCMRTRSGRTTSGPYARRDPKPKGKPVSDHAEDAVELVPGRARSPAATTMNAWWTGKMARLEEEKMSPSSATPPNILLEDMTVLYPSADNIPWKHPSSPTPLPRGPNQKTAPKTTHKTTPLTVPKTDQDTALKTAPKADQKTPPKGLPKTTPKTGQQPTTKQYESHMGKGDNSCVDKDRVCELFLKLVREGYRYMSEEDYGDASEEGVSDSSEEDVSDSSEDEERPTIEDDSSISKSLSPVPFHFPDSKSPCPSRSQPDTEEHTDQHVNNPDPPDRSPCPVRNCSERPYSPLPLFWDDYHDSIIVESIEPNWGRYPGHVKKCVGLDDFWRQWEKRERANYDDMFYEKSPTSSQDVEYREAMDPPYHYIPNDDPRRIAYYERHRAHYERYPRWYRSRGIWFLEKKV